MYHLRNILCTSDKHVMIDSAVKDLNCRLNNLLADFSHCNSNTLFTLFNSYCMNVYGCLTLSDPGYFRQLTIRGGGALKAPPP